MFGTYRPSLFSESTGDYYSESFSANLEEINAL